MKLKYIHDDWLTQVDVTDALVDGVSIAALQAGRVGELVRAAESLLQFQAAIEFSDSDKPQLIKAFRDLATAVRKFKKENA